MVCRGWYVVWYVEDGMYVEDVWYVVWYAEDGMLYGMQRMVCCMVCCMV